MVKSRLSIITYTLLVITSGLAVYYYYQSLQLDSLESDKIHQLTKENKSLNAIKSADEAFLQGRFEEAKSMYKELLKEDSLFQHELEQRIVITEESLGKLNMDDKSDSLVIQDKADTVISLASGNTADGRNIRQYDSLYFALTKAKTQINNLSRQLKNRSKGAYLTFTTKKGNTANYVGQVKNNMANGKGVALYNTGSRYEGEWKNNLKHGNGSFYWPDGEYYEGEYYDDLRQGIGTYYWPNGEKYVGNWQNDKRNGNGIFYGEDGEVVAQGVWKEDELVNEKPKK